jgi:SPP1 family predicted phage head-tail adaptor
MQAGKLRHRLQFQAPIEDRDTTGDDLGTYEDQFTVYGSLEPLDARTFFAAQQTNPEITGQVRVRYSEQASQIAASWRILHEGHIYELISPPLNPDGRDRELLMFIKEMPHGGAQRN